MDHAVEFRFQEGGPGQSGVLQILTSRNDAERQRAITEVERYLQARGYTRIVIAREIPRAHPQTPHIFLRLASQCPDAMSKLDKELRPIAFPKQAAILKARTGMLNGRLVLETMPFSSHY